MAALVGADGSFSTRSFIFSTLFSPSLRARCLPLLLAPRPLHCALRPPHSLALSHLEGGDTQPCHRRSASVPLPRPHRLLSLAVSPAGSAMFHGAPKACDLFPILLFS